MYNEEVKNKIRFLVDKVNQEIDGECYVYMSRFNCEWYQHLSINFNYSNLHIDVSIAETTIATQTANELLVMVINFIKAEIISNYFK